MCAEYFGLTQYERKIVLRSEAAGCLRGSANIHHTQLTLITFKRKAHKDLVNCQSLDEGPKAGLSIIADRPFDYF